MGKINDLKLIEILLRDGRKSFVDIAKELGVTEAAIRKRVKKLIDTGIIRKFTIDVDAKKLGFKHVACIGIDTEPEELMHVVNKLKGDPKIKELYTSAGDHMIMLLAWFKDHEELDAYLNMLEGLKGVKKVCPAMLLEKIK